MNDSADGGFIELTADIVSAYVSNNSVSAGEIPNLINQVHSALMRVSGGQSDTQPEPLKPAVSVKKSITPDYLVCLEDGKKFKSLKRHLRTQYNMTPEQYRDKWGLPPDYPMVAPSYAAARSQLAKQMGLGQQRRRRRSRRLRRGCQRGARIRVDALDHRAEAVRALRRQMLAQAEPVEQRDRVGRQDFARRLARIEREQDRDQAAHDMRVAVADEGQRRPGGAVRARRVVSSQTWLAQPCTLLVSLRACSGSGASIAPELDHIAIAIVPVVEDGESCR